MAARGDAELPVGTYGDVYPAARRVISAGLESDDSAFTPGSPVWTAANAEDLLQRLVASPQLGSVKFMALSHFRW